VKNYANASGGLDHAAEIFRLWRKRRYAQKLLSFLAPQTRGIFITICAGAERQSGGFYGLFSC
jgi:hypothetical protein